LTKTVSVLISIVEDELQVYKNAGKIREEYPKILDRKMMDEIIDQWNAYISTSRPEMFFFSASSPFNGEHNLSELELYLRFKMAHHKNELLTASDFLDESTQKSIGMIVASWCESLMSDDEPYSENLRELFLKETLDMWKANAKNYQEQKKGILTRLQIKKDVMKSMAERYPNYQILKNTSSFSDRMWDIVENFVLDNNQK
jgi:hypothetical protein